MTGWCVPCNAEAIDVVQTIAEGDLGLCGLFAGNVGDELGEGVGMDLFGQRMVRGDEDVLEKAFFSGRDVGKPATHGGRVFLRCFDGRQCATDKFRRDPLSLKLFKTSKSSRENEHEELDLSNQVSANLHFHDLSPGQPVRRLMITFLLRFWVWLP